MASSRPPAQTPHPSRRRAVIDIGTNSVKLLIAGVAGSTVTPVLERSEQTRLGSGFYQTHLLQPVPITRTAQAVARFAAEAADQEVSSIRVIATSAARDARNPEELLAAIRTHAGLRAEIISGAQEAQWVFEGVTSDPALAGRPLLIVDAGGGSTEFILGAGPKQHFRQSFPLGTVRLLDQVEVSDPPSAREWRRCRDRLNSFFKSRISPVLQPRLRDFEAGSVQLVGTSGTASILASMELGIARFQRERIEGTGISLTQIHRRRRQIWRLPLAGRRRIAGLPANRADVILAGVAIYEAVMETFGFRSLRISTRGLRFGALLH